VTEATFTKFSSSATFDVVIGVGGPQTWSTNIMTTKLTARSEPSDKAAKAHRWKNHFE